ncbi:hypothetical protein [Puniceibacterium antarcticum]|nr:hypothetical protein [Puniceibacterium antarcticum]
MDNLELCQLHSSAEGNSPYLAELVKRGALTNQELEDISSETIRTGMKTYVAVCSWGPYESINSSGGIYGDTEQIVISLSQYIYTENGRVTQWQQ